MTALVLQLFLSTSNPNFDLLHYLVRKTGHVLAYGLLGFLDFRAVRGGGSGWTLRWSVIAVVLAVIVASVDEWHQSFVPDRTGTPVDVLIDCAGATLAQVIWKATEARGPRPEA